MLTCNVKGKYYLNEFYYKLNRRYFVFNVFERITLAISQ